MLSQKNKDKNILQYLIIFELLHCKHEYLQILVVFGPTLSYLLQLLVFVTTFF